MLVGLFLAAHSCSEAVLGPRRAAELCGAERDSPAIGGPHNLSHLWVMDAVLLHSRLFKIIFLETNLRWS